MNRCKIDDFNDMLDLCSFEVQVRYSYLLKQLEETWDQIMETMTRIEEYKVEKEVAREMGWDSEVIRITKEINDITQDWAYLEARYEALETLENELFIDIVKSYSR